MFKRIIFLYGVWFLLLILRSVNKNTPLNDKTYVNNLRNETRQKPDEF